MSRCTTSSSYLRPMRRLMANRVFCGLVTAWRLAGCPTSTSLSLVNATMDGVVRSPSLFSITRGLPPSMMATHELVVPRSMPITFAIGLLRQNLFQSLSITKGIRSSYSFWGMAERIQDRCAAKCLVFLRRLGNDHPGRAQQPPIELVAGLDHLEHRIR